LWAEFRVVVFCITSETPRPCAFISRYLSFSPLIIFQRANDGEAIDSDRMSDDVKAINSELASLDVKATSLDGRRHFHFWGVPKVVSGCTLA
jgi:hypothetical protein